MGLDDEEPQRIACAPQVHVITDSGSVAAAVKKTYKEVGYLLDKENDPALLVDVLCHDFPVIGMSRGSEQLTGHTREEVLGKNCRYLLEGVPEVAISKSNHKNFQDFCRMSRFAGVSSMAETVSLQLNSRKDGSMFMNLLMVCVCLVDNYRFILGVQKSVSKGVMRNVTDSQFACISEESRAALLRLRRLLCGRQDPALKHCLGPWMGNGPRLGMSFFDQRLQDHCVLLNQNRTVLRREPLELASGCLVFGDRPVRLSEHGLYFSLLVDGVVDKFEGLPLLGFTRRKPSDTSDLYPAVTNCLRASVLIGSVGEAFARDQDSHYPPGFKLPPSHEVQVWQNQPDVKWHKRKAPVVLRTGDKLGCLYTHGGRLQLWVNDKIALDFDLERPLKAGVDYYPVVDVCYQAYMLTIIPEASRPQAEQETTVSSQTEVAAEPIARCLDAPPAATQAPAEINQGAPGWHSDGAPVAHLDVELVQRTIREAVEKCDFCMTVADPLGDSVPLIAVSEAFEVMTGYKRKEILGTNCRFLNNGCDVSCLDIIGLRTSAANGSPFVALLPNRMKCGELFVNMLDLQGLAVARNVSTGQLLWYCIGIQADVTEVEDYATLSRHTRERAEIAQLLRDRLRSAALAEGRPPGMDASPEEAEYKLLAEPMWMTDTEGGGGADEGAAGTVLLQAATLAPGAPGLMPEKQPSGGWWRGLWAFRPWADRDKESRESSFRAFARAYTARVAGGGSGHALAKSLTSALLPADALADYKSFCGTTPGGQLVPSMPSGLGLLVFLFGAILCGVKQLPAACANVVLWPT